jgi:hypothetical protein
MYEERYAEYRRETHKTTVTTTGHGTTRGTGKNTRPIRKGKGWTIQQALRVFQQTLLRAFLGAGHEADCNKKTATMDISKPRNWAHPQ